MPTMQATLNTLAAFPAELERHFALFPTEFRHWAPASWDGVPSEPFTAIEQLCHLRDIEIEGYQVRFRRTLEECEAAMREAIEFHIEGLRLAGDSVPPATSHVAVVTVAA